MTMFLVAILCTLIALLIVLYYIHNFPSKPLVNFSLKDSLSLVNIPIVTMKIQDKELNFVVDTGADQSYINESALIGVEYMATDIKKYVVSATGELQCSICELDLEYEGNFFPTTVYIADLTESFNKVREDSGVIIHGILGNSFLIKYKYILDFSDLKMFTKK